MALLQKGNQAPRMPIWHETTNLKNALFTFEISISYSKTRLMNSKVQKLKYNIVNNFSFEYKCSKIKKKLSGCNQWSLNHEIFHMLSLLFFTDRWPRSSFIVYEILVFRSYHTTYTTLIFCNSNHTETLAYLWLICIYLWVLYFMLLIDILILTSYVIGLVLYIYKSESNPVYFQCKLPNIKYKFSDLKRKRVTARARIQRKVRRKWMTEWKK